VTRDKKISATDLKTVARIFAAIILVLLVYSLFSGLFDITSIGQQAGTTSGAAVCATATAPAPGITSIPPPGVCPSGIITVPATPVVPDTIAQSTISLTRPAAPDLVPYTLRNFTQPQEAAIAWWMSPGFQDNTTEFRSNERLSPEAKAKKPEEIQIFYNFIENNLDGAEHESVLQHDIILFRGINPYVADTVIQNAQYREPAFASTAYDITVSLGMFGQRTSDGYRNVLVLQRHPGDHALYINDDEREFLLPRGMTWNVIKAVNIGNLTVSADFPLYSGNVSSFDYVRLIYIKENPCP
jgi:hypothetical protein